MLERIIENWLDKATELSYQQPFCYILSAEGYTIIHSTRHTAMELGVDIIAIAPDETPCAFQLKTGNISLKKWRDEVGSQTDDLVCGQLNHPSVDNTKHHKSYFVTNGRIEEEVCRLIDDRNRAWENQDQSYRHLKTIVGGELFEKAKRLGIDLWPSELKDTKTLLEMFLENGKGMLPKDKLASLFESTFSLDSDKEISKKECRRIIASAGLLCMISISSFSNENNHVAEIEAWILYIAYVFAFVEKQDLNNKIYNNAIEIAKQAIYDTLSNLCVEIKERKNLNEGDDPMIDSYVYRVRMTLLLGLMGIYSLWRVYIGEAKDETDNFIQKFCNDKWKQLECWGEAAIPQWLSFIWFLEKNVDETLGNKFLKTLIPLITNYNSPNGNGILSNPYYQAEDILPHLLGISKEPFMDSFKGQSYALEGLVHLCVRRDLKESIRKIWPDVTRLVSTYYEPDDYCEFFKWRSEKGKNAYKHFNHTQEWNELKLIASESDGKCIPPTIKEHPILLLLFLCVYPHRMNAEIMRWLDTQMQQIPRP